MKKLISAIFIIVLIASTLSACNNIKKNSEPTTTVTENETQKQEQSDDSEYAIETCNDDILFAKPVIYLYPTEKTKLTVTLGKPQNLTCTYPHYENSWDVTAFPDGKLIDNKRNRELYCLYWEGISKNTSQLTEGFVVKGTDTIAFLEEKLAILGLNEAEAQEFIIYWLPVLQENEYNLIRFATIDEINKEMPIEFSVTPDTLIRVLMQFKPLEHNINIKEQKLTPAKRNGFTAVEWGGCKID
ncbi:MAG: hypothetical protein IJ433_04470 [Ruminococcus sp.]|nr:hypothetical protein [Ruminococcus sp.]